MAKGKQEFVATGVAARRLSVSEDSIRRMCDRGALESVRIEGQNNARAILRSSLEQMVAKRNAKT